ncbi:MAG TPA: hypothetical protein VFE17_02580 [Candidatus Baltobacteraceae bacterium]|nr:hypothetical protein [Candidatus Baltobacteraceae bacterium]
MCGVLGVPIVACFGLEDPSVRRRYEESLNDTLPDEYLGVCGMQKLTVEQLAQLLHDAELAHAEHERTLGQTDQDWPRWYAEYILDRVPEARWE